MPAIFNNTYCRREWPVFGQGGIYRQDRLGPHSKNLEHLMRLKRASKINHEYDHIDNFLPLNFLGGLEIFFW